MKRCFRMRVCALMSTGVLGVSPVFAQGAPVEPLTGSAGSAAPAPELETWLAARRDGRGRACERHAVETHGRTIYVACGESGVWLVRPTPSGFEWLGAEDLGGVVTGFFVHDGRVWAEIRKTEARPIAAVAETGGAPPGSAASPAPRSDAPSVPEVPSPSGTPEPVRAHEGRVTEVGLGEVVVDLGRQHGVRDGNSVELVGTVVEEVGGERAERHTVLAVGVVTVVAERFSRVRLGMNERVPVGARARVVARAPTRRRIAPPRLGGLWELELRARPFLALDTLGGGVLADLSVGYRFDSNLHLELAFRPLGFGVGEGAPAVVPVVGYAAIGYDGDLFGVGLGLGGQTVNSPDFGTPSGSGTVFVQAARLGARDGLNLDCRTGIVLFHSRFDFSWFAATGQIPVGDTTWLVLGGGGGSAGYGYGEIGLRALLRGNGDRGSLFFTGTVGGVGLFEDIERTCGGPNFSFSCPEIVEYGGPMVGAGVELRL